MFWYECCIGIGWECCIGIGWLIIGCEGYATELRLEREVCTGASP